MKKVPIIGATSAIAEATARLFAARGDSLYLVGRNAERLQTMAADLVIRGASAVDTQVLNANSLREHRRVLEQAQNQLGRVDIALIAHGTLPDQKACEQNFGLALRELNTNAISVISMLTQLANTMEAQGSGTLAVIGSVAGDRGRQSNYVYGSAKGMVATFTQGLRNRLHKSGVQVLLIKPGFVDTPMTADFDKSPLWAQPQDIAEGIIKGIDKNKSEIYLPFFWRYIMLIIKMIPEKIFVRLSL
jgi:decaprenylphospho-beta-D-erythro-pentofuranosid-2-ulose 2-reductase